MVNFKDWLIKGGKKLKTWQMVTLSAIGLITTFEMAKPYVEEGYLFFKHMYQSQKDYEKIASELKHYKEYHIVLNHIVDGVSTTRHHRSVRYLVTTIEFDNPQKEVEYYDLSDLKMLKYDLANRDWYYLAEDIDGNEKWLRAIYTSDYDTFSYIDHDGHHHLIKPLSESIVKKRR